MPFETKTRPALVLLLLFGFFFYSATISCGLTSAGEFITFLVLNPDNNRLGLSFGAPAFFGVTMQVRGQQRVEITRAEGTPPESPLVPFAKSSGQTNFGCDETRELSVEFVLPKGAMLAGAPTVAWQNTSNIGGEQQDFKINGPAVIGHGTVRGLPYQNFAIARNCPGGGHGELVLSGTYRPAAPAPAVHTRIEVQDASTQLVSKVQAGANLPVWVTLPDYTILSIRANFQSEANPLERAELTVTPDRSSASQGEYVLVYDANGKRVALLVRSRWQELRAKLHL